MATVEKKVSDPQEQIMAAESDLDGSSQSPKGLLANLDLQRIDKAAEFLATIGPYPPMTPEAEKKMMKKIDGWMIPFVSQSPQATPPSLSLAPL